MSTKTKIYEKLVNVRLSGCTILSSIKDRNVQIKKLRKRKTNQEREQRIKVLNEEINELYFSAKRVVMLNMLLENMMENIHD